MMLVVGRLVGSLVVSLCRSHVQERQYQAQQNAGGQNPRQQSISHSWLREILFEMVWTFIHSDRVSRRTWLKSKRTASLVVGVPLAPLTPAGRP